MQGLELLTPYVVGIDLKEDVRPTLQIEPKHEVTLRKVEEWATGGGRSPSEILMKRKVKAPLAG